jgi:hypothetical protein
VIAKEIRALLPVWAAAVAALIASALVRDLYRFGIPAYFVAAATLGAMSVGHEYSHRTLSLMLTLPVSRRRVLLTKLLVLAAFLLLFAALAAWFLPQWGEASLFRTTVVWLPFFAALFVAPYLTIITRSPVGGAVFTIGLAGMLMVAGEWIGVKKYGYSSEVDAFRVAFVWSAEVVLCAASALLMWRTFTSLEAVEGPGPGIDLAPRTAVTSTSLTRRSVTRLLIEKELRIQQLSLGIAVIFVVVYIAFFIRTRGFVQQNDGAALLSLLFASVSAIVIGAVASAEERHLRTLDAQLLLPMRASRQWLVKVAVVLGLTLLLGVVLPTILAALFPPEHIRWARDLRPTAAASTVLALMALATLSLYVSTLCSSGLWALLLSLPAAFGFAAFLMNLWNTLERILYEQRVSLNRPLVGWLAALLTIVIIGLVLRLAFDNHRSADRSRSRIVWQVALGAAAAVVAVLVVGLAGAVIR